MKKNLRARNRIMCPYCKSIRFTTSGLQDHIKTMHPGNISPSGILLATPEVTQNLQKLKILQK